MSDSKGLLDGKASDLACNFLDMDRFMVSVADPAPGAGVLQSFDDLPPDDYLQGSWVYRKRAYVRGQLGPEGIAWDSSTDFFQAASINTFAGDIKRVFASAGETIREYVWQTLQSPFYRAGLGAGTYDFGLHQIRIVCDELNEGHPVPEGFHQDGFDVVVIQSYQRQNIIGGKSYLREDSKDGPCILERDLEPGAILAFNDRRLFHYADPIRSQTSSPGHRDLCVMTFSLQR